MILKVHELYFKSKFTKKIHFSFNFFLRTQADVLLLLDTYPPRSKYL